MLGRLVRAAPIGVCYASAAIRTSCAPKNNFEKAAEADDLEMLEILLAGTRTAVPTDLAADIIWSHKGDEARVRTLVDTAIARGADADAALRVAYRRLDQAMLAHLLKGRTAVPSDSIRLLVAGELRRRNSYEAVNNAPLLARIQEAAALGADPSEVGWCGSDCAILDAIEMCDAELVGSLLRLGADPTAVDYRKRSATWHAIDKKQPQIVRLLLEAEAKRSAP